MGKHERERVEQRAQGQGAGAARGRGGRGGRGQAARGRGGGQRGKRIGRPLPNRTQGTSEVDGGDAGAPRLPGLNKLNAALRQAKRLLARDDLNPETRQEAERKLVALEEDIEAKKAENEVMQAQEAVAAMVAKNRKRIFFDSAKVIRKIEASLKKLARAERALQAGEGDGKALKKEAEDLRKTIERHRLILNYATHWPATERYCRFRQTEATFDPTAHVGRPKRVKGAGDDTEDDDSDSDDEGSHDGNGQENASTAGSARLKKRINRLKRQIDVGRRHRAWVEKAMAEGELSAEPEKEATAPGKKAAASASSSVNGAGTSASGKARAVSSDQQGSKDHKAKRRRTDVATDAHDSGAESPMPQAGIHAQEPPRKKGKQDKKDKRRDPAPQASEVVEDSGIQDDDFFDT